MFDLPPELWLMIFGLLPRRDAANISLACRRFLDIAQPLLFTFVTFSLHHDQDDFTTFLDKLSFCTNPRIATRLGCCTICVDFEDDGRHSPRPLRITGHEADSDTDSGIDSDTDSMPELPVSLSDSDLTRHADILLNVFSVLPQFINIRAIHFSNFKLTPFHFSQISAMPSLEALVLHQYCITTSQLPVLSLPTVTFHDDMALSPLWMSLFPYILNPAFLQQLIIMSICRIDTIAEELVRLGPWPTLLRLAIDTGHINPSSFYPLLRQCPMLEELSVRTMMPEELAEHTFRLLPDIVPNLTTFRGQLEAAPSAMAGRTLRHLETTFVGNLADVGIFLAESGSACARLETLNILVTEVSHELLSRIAVHCPGLRELYITGPCLAQSSAMDLLRFFAHAIYPPRIATFQCVTPDAAPIPVALGEEARTEQQALTALYDALHDVALSNGLYQMRFDPATGLTINGGEVGVPRQLRFGEY